MVTYLTMTIDLHLVIVAYLAMTKLFGKQTRYLFFCHSFSTTIIKKQTKWSHPHKKTVTNTFTCTYYCDARSWFHRTMTIGFSHEVETYGDDYCP